MLYGPEREVPVMVWNRTIKIALCQISKSAWRASGDYMGESHEARGATAGQAVEAWKAWAHTKGG
jgi:hypothetical protein